MIRIARDQAALFASDMHLSDTHPDTAQLFLSRLDEYARGVQALFFLGDLFDAWVGDDALDAANEATCAQRFVTTLRRCADQGTIIYVMRGNRDFLLGVDNPQAATQRFCKATGAVLLPDPCVVDLQGEPVVLAHGDALCTDDTDYQAFRQLSRSAAWQRDFLGRPLATRLAAAKAMRDQSEQSKSGKHAEWMDVNPEAVAELLRANACRILIHGHTHRPAHHRFTLDGAPAQRWVLPDWATTAEAGAQRAGMLLARDGMLSPVGDWPAMARP